MEEVEKQKFVIGKLPGNFNYSDFKEKWVKIIKN